MKIKPGDTVRFLNQSGGGIVTRVEDKLVYVNDEDGFEIPVMINEVVVIADASPKTAVSTPDAAQAAMVEEDEDDDYDYVADEGDDQDPKFYIAFRSGDKPGVESGNLRVSVVNDSNYFVYYTISYVRKDGELDLLFNGLIEPNTKMPLDTMGLMQLDDRQWKVQLLLFKKGRSYVSNEPVVEIFKIKAARFFKDNSFIENDFYNEKAVLIPIIKGDYEKMMEQLATQNLDKIAREKEAKPVRKSFARRDEPGILEVDLHIDELIDSTAGLSNGEILTIQMDRFKQVMLDNVKNKGRKLVFIHGVGSGVLKTELRKLLDRQYKKHQYQDASFAEYGYGATMVII